MTPLLAMETSSWITPETVPQLAEKSSFNNIIVDKSSLIDLEAQQWVTGRKQASAVQRERLSGKTPIGDATVWPPAITAHETGEGDPKRLPRLQVAGHVSNRSYVVFGLRNFEHRAAADFQRRDFPNPPSGGVCFSLRSGGTSERR